MRQLLTFIAGFSPDALDASLAAIGRPAVLPRVHVHLFGQDGICTLCDLDIVTWSEDAELDHIAIEGTRS